MNIIISNTSNEPLYKQIKKQVKKAIINKEIDEGYQLPSIRFFANELEVSVITIRKVYEELEAEGFIKSQIGVGTFVLTQNIEILRETKKFLIEQKLGEAIDEGLDLGLELEEFLEMLKLLYSERRS